MHGIPQMARSALLDDDNFLVVYNFTPTQSVSIVDLKERRFIGEIATPGCALTYAAGNRTFFQICNDGKAMVITLDETGKSIARKKTNALFDPEEDLILETGVRVGNQWYFLSLRGRIVSVDVGGDTVRLQKTWPMDEGHERAELDRPLFEVPGEPDPAVGWQAGGIQPIAIHQDSGMAYVLTREGPRHAYEDPAIHIWIVDLKEKKKVGEYKLDSPAMSIAVSQDSSPLLYVVDDAEFMHGLDVYDAQTGAFIRNIPEVGMTPTLLQTIED